MNGISPPFEDRRDAGRQLATRLLHWKDAQPMVLALPRGGVPVAYEVAQAVLAPLDLLLVRKIGAPGFPELAIGAVVEGNPAQQVLNIPLIEQLCVPEHYIASENQRQLAEIKRRRRRYRNERPFSPVKGRTVIIVDDGIATGATMESALQAVAQQGANQIVLAVPVGAPAAIARLSAYASQTVCLVAPAAFRAVGQYYRNFDQTGDDEVMALLQASHANAAPFAAAFSQTPLPDPGQHE